MFGVVLSLLFVVAVSTCNAQYQCGEQTSIYSSIHCIRKGDYGNITALKMCTICNLYMVNKNFFFFPDPNDKRPREVNISYNFLWKPATIFGRYDLRAKIISQGQMATLQRLAPNLVELNTTSYLVPRLEGNYCHAVNDVVGPMFWRIRQQQQLDVIDRNNVQLITLHSRPHPGRHINHFMRIFSSRKHMEAGHLPSTTLYRIREAVVGAWGMTVHMNQNYYWHNARYIVNMPFSMRSIYNNLHLMREHFHRYYDVPDVGRKVLKGDYIIIANRRVADERGRSALNAESTLARFKKHFGDTENIYPEVLYFEEWEMDNLTSLLAQTKVLIAPHGAGMSNLVLMRKGAAVIELIPYMCHRLRIMFSPIAEAMGMHYTYWQPTDNLVPSLLPQKRRELMMLASTKREPCPQSMSRTNFNLHAGQLIELIKISLDFVQYEPQV